MALAKKMLPFFGVALVLHMALLLVVFQLPEHSLEAAPAPTLSLLPAGLKSKTCCCLVHPWLAIKMDEINKKKFN
jgi:hypothetical protein